MEIVRFILTIVTTLYLSVFVLIFGCGLAVMQQDMQLGKEYTFKTFFEDIKGILMFCLQWPYLVIKLR